METKPEIKAFDIAVIYADGSAWPNPGYYGSGVHGYIYNTNDIGKSNGDKPNKYILTTLGYVETTELGKFEDIPDEYLVEMIANNDANTLPINRFKTVVPTHYINAIFTHDNAGTNNMAEVLAFTISVEELLSLENFNIKKILIKTDSAYLLHIIDKVFSGTYDWKALVDKNIHLWEKVHNVNLTAKAMGVEIVPMKVPGHSTVLGNNIADRLAFVARDNAMYTPNKHEFKVIPAKKYWGVLVKDIHS